eukprot:143769-Rhodomonas_salina.1
MEGAWELSQADLVISLRRSLRTLKIGSVPSERECYDREGKCLHLLGIKILAPALACCESLTELDLSGTGRITVAAHRE